MLSLNCRRRGKHIATPVGWVTARLVVICLGPVNPLNGLLSVCPRLCAGHEILWLQVRCVLRRKLT